MKLATGSDASVLITGATGFLGSHILRAALGAHMHVVVLKRSWSDTRRIADLLPLVVVYDIDTGPSRSAFERRPIDIVIHAATSYGRNGETPSQMLDANVAFPLAILDLAVEFGAAAFLNTDSFSSRGTQLVEGLGDYVHTKRLFREAAHNRARNASTRFVNVQLEHVFGPEDDATKFIPSLVTALMAHQPMFPLTGGEQSRDFIYVDDVVSAYLALVAHSRSGGSMPAEVEVGWGLSTPLRETVELIRDLCESRTQLLFGALPYRAGELMHSKADNAALVDLGWSPRISIREGLERTIAAMAEARKPLDVSLPHAWNEPGSE